MQDEVIKEDITGARNLRSFSIMLILLFAGFGFFLAGLSSYLNRNLLIITDTSEIKFVPQGIVMLFYGTGALGLAIYSFFNYYLEHWKWV